MNVTPQNAQPLKVAVFGATGAIGQLTVARLVAEGHAVTAYVRTPSKVPDTWGEDVTVVVGDMNDAAAIDSAVAGTDAVINAAGPSMDRKATGLPLVEGVKNILHAMARHGVRRYVGHGTPSLLDAAETPTFQTKMSSFMARTFLPRAHEELVGMGGLITAADLDWTIVRFMRPTDSQPTGTVRSGFFGTDKLGFAITRADIAEFTVDQLADTRYLRRLVGVSN